MPPGLVIDKIRRSGSTTPLGLNSGETSHPGFPSAAPGADGGAPLVTRGLQSSRPCRDLSTRAISGVSTPKMRVFVVPALAGSSLLTRTLKGVQRTLSSSPGEATLHEDSLALSIRRHLSTSIAPSHSEPKVRKIRKKHK